MVYVRRGREGSCSDHRSARHSSPSSAVAQQYRPSRSLRNAAHPRARLLCMPWIFAPVRWMIRPWLRSWNADFLSGRPVAERAHALRSRCWLSQSCGHHPCHMKAAIAMCPRDPGPARSSDSQILGDLRRCGCPWRSILSETSAATSSSASNERNSAVVTLCRHSGCHLAASAQGRHDRHTQGKVLVQDIRRSRTHPDVSHNARQWCIRSS